MSNPYREIIRKLDGLAKARFIETFGDIRVNSKSFPTVNFGEYTDQMNIGPFGSDLKNDCFVPESEGYCMVYEQKHAIDKDFSSEKRYISKDKYEQLRRFDVGPGDILVSCRGTVGKCVLLPEGSTHGVIHPSLMMIRPKPDVNPRFLLLLLEKILESQIEEGSGVKMAIQASKLSKIQTIHPSRELQDKFVSFMTQLDIVKSIAMQAADKYDLLVKSRFIEITKSNIERKTLSDLSLEWFRGQGLRKDELDENGNRYCIHYGELFTKYGPVITEVCSKTSAVPSKVSAKGDILFPASDVTPNGLAKCSELECEDVILGGDIICLRPKTEVNPAFLSYAINAEKQQLLQGVTGSIVKHMSSKWLKGIVVSIPNDKCVQDEFVSFAKQVDKSKFVDSGGDE